VYEGEKLVITQVKLEKIKWAKKHYECLLQNNIYKMINNIQDDICDMYKIEKKHLINLIAYGDSNFNIN
jgi:hypothetical protein